MARRRPIVPSPTVGEGGTLYPVGSPNYMKDKNRGNFAPYHTDVGHGPMNFGAEAGPPNPTKYTHVNPVRTLKPVRRKRK